MELEKQFQDRWSVNLVLDNIFDQSYIASTAGVLDRARQKDKTTIFLPGTGRRVEFSIKYRW